MFEFDMTDILKLKIRKLLKKDREKVKIINKKIKEIISCDMDSIRRYKDLKYGMKTLKRVHIDKHFVLTFHVDHEAKKILFYDFDHHDVVYERKG